MPKKKQAKSRKAAASDTAEPAPVISIPKPARRSYDPARSLDKNLLIKAQVQHFHEVDRHLPDELQTGIDPDSVRTEGEAAEYIRTVTERLHGLGERREKARRAT